MTEELFVTLEGIDGSGKTTVANALSEEFDAVMTSEPSQYWTGEQVRATLGEETPSPFVDFLLFMADRVAHIEDTIKPALEDGQNVISDRYADSTRVYQTPQLKPLMRSEPSTEVYIERVMDPWSLEPDLTLFLDISVDTAMERIDVDEKYETRENLEEVRDRYKELAHLESRVLTVNAEKPVKEVIDRCRTLIELEKEKGDWFA